MSNIHGFTRDGVAAKLPDDVRTGAKLHIKKLNESGVQPSAQNGPTFKLVDATTALKGDLTTTFARSNAKANSIIANLSNEALSGGVHEKLEKRLSADAQKGGQQAAQLSHQLHFSGAKALLSGTNVHDRVVIRAALVLAFAHGANLDETARLKEFLTKASPATRNIVFDELNKPDANASRILNYHQLGPAFVADDAQAKLQALATRTAAFDFKGSVSRADDYLTNVLGLDPKDDDNRDTRIGALAVAAYTDNTYLDVNKALRDQAGRKGELAGDMDLLTRAATQFMNKMDDFEGIVIRGAGAGLQDKFRERYVPGQVVTEHQFTSTSPDLGFDTPIKFVIESHHGKDVSALSANAKTDGHEVLFPPGAKFEVLGVVEPDQNAANTWGTDVGQRPMVIIMREVE
jgi:hypothetical protein